MNIISFRLPNIKFRMMESERDELFTIAENIEKTSGIFMALDYYETDAKCNNIKSIMKLCKYYSDNILMSSCLKWCNSAISLANKEQLTFIANIYDKFFMCEEADKIRELSNGNNTKFIVKYNPIFLTERLHVIGLYHKSIKNTKKMIKYFSDAADQNCTKSIGELIEYYKSVDNCINCDKWKFILNELKKGDSSVKKLKGDWYKINVDYDNMVKCYTNAANCHDVSAIKELINYYKKNDIDNYLIWKINLAQLGNNNDILDLAQYYKDINNDSDCHYWYSIVQNNNYAEIIAPRFIRDTKELNFMIFVNDDKYSSVIGLYKKQNDIVC